MWVGRIVALDLLLNHYYFRLAPRRGVRYCKGEGGDPRCALILLTDRPLSSQPEKLSNSKFNTPDDLGAFVQKFDEGVKKVFSNDQAVQYVKFGHPRDNDPELRIKAGRLTLDG